MREIRYAEAFIEGASFITKKSKRQDIRRRIEKLADRPRMGSTNLPESIVDQYGPNVRKLVVHQFLVIYETSDDTIDVLGIVRQRSD